MNRVSDLFMANLLFVYRESNGSDGLTSKDCTWFQSVTTASLSLGCSFNALQLHPSFCDHSMYYNNSNWAVRTIQIFAATTPSNVFWAFNSPQQLHPSFCDHSVHCNNSIWAFVISQCTVTTPKFELCVHSMHCNHYIGVLCEVNAPQQCNCIHELCVHSIASTTTASKLCLHSRAGATLQAPLTTLGNPDWTLGIQRETWYFFCVHWRTDLFFPLTYQG